MKTYFWKLLKNRLEMGVLYDIQNLPQLVTKINLKNKNTF